MFHSLADSAWSGRNLAVAAGQLGKMVEHTNQSQHNPGPRADGTPCTVPLNNFRVRTDGVQDNQMHCDVSCALEVPNLDFQPIPQLSKF